MEDYGSADNKGNILWVNPTTGETVIHQLNPETAASAVTAAILKLYLDSQNHLWIATKKELTIYNHQTHECIATQHLYERIKK